MSDRSTHQYSLAEEIAHAITHGVGLLLSIAGLVVLIVLGSLRGDAWHVVSVSVYGATLVLLYSASTFYHALPAPRAKFCQHTGAVRLVLQLENGQEDHLLQLT